MGRVLGSIGIAILLALAVALPYTSAGRRGPDASVRADVPAAAGRIGEPLPDFELVDLEGGPVSLESLRGHRVVLTFERSIDW